MNKEELEKEAGEWLKSNIKTENREGITFNIVPTSVQIYLAGAEPREKRIAELEAENERIKTKYYELQDTLKKVRLALIKERTANIMNYGKGGVEMFDSMFEILKGVSN